MAESSPLKLPNFAFWYRCMPVSLFLNVGSCHLLVLLLVLPGGKGEAGEKSIGCWLVVEIVSERNLISLSFSLVLFCYSLSVKTHLQTDFASWIRFPVFLFQNLTGQCFFVAKENDMSQASLIYRLIQEVNYYFQLPSLVKKKKKRVKKHEAQR